MKKIISLLICTMILMTGMTGVKVSAAELPNLALNKSATASTIWSDSFSADKAFDGDTNSRWGSKGTASEYWITVDLESVQAINKMAIDEYDARIGAFQILYSNDGQNWKVGYEGRMTGTSSANHRRKTFEFEEFEGRYIKLSTTEATKEITIWEIGLYFDAEKSDSGNVASGKTATASTIKSEEYKADNVTDNSNTTFWKPGDGDTTPNIMIDLEKIVPINYIRILEEKDNISKLHIEYSTDNLVWTTAKDAVCSATGAVSNRDSRIEFPAINARYVKITVSESIAPASIGNIRIACARSCDTFWYYKAASAINESVITSEKLDEITADINKGLITHIDNANYSADIEWTSSDETVVNVLTGVVNRSNIDQNVTLTAKITMGGVASAAPVNIKTFDLTVKATEPSETLLGFDVPELKNRIKNVENGSVLEENGEFKIKSNADSVGTTKFDLAKIKKFDINSSFCAEIELTNKNFTENKIYFKNGENEIISIAFTPEKYTIFYGEKGKPIQTEINEAVQDKKIKLELWFDFEKNTFDVYEKNDEGYRHIIINKPILTEENSFDNIVFATSENAEICISDFKLRMNKIDMPTYLEKNFTFDKISTETPGNITKDFDLIKNVFGAEVVWDSSEQNLINSSTGKIKIPEKETAVILKATVTYNQESFEKEFNIIMGLNNLCDEKIITSTARATDGTNIKNLNDNDRTTYFKTKVKKSFEITVDLEREVDVSKVMLLGDNLENIIKKYSVHISNDNKKYVKICDEKSGTLSFIPIPIQKARFVKLVIDEKTDEAVSLSEFVVGFSPTDEQIVNADILNLVMPEEVSESFEATLIAPYGAEMEYKSSKENVIRFEKSGDKVNAVVTKPENSSIVTVTAVAKFGRASQSSIYNIAVKGYKNIPNDKPSSSGGGGGNSGGRPPSNIINTTPEDVITPETPDQKFNDELNGHWAEKEIREMINLEIINGDEGSLKLENNITRAEFIAMIVRSMKLDIATNTNKFSDVESGSWYADYIETAFANNLISGDGGEIRPNDAISREEMSKIIVNTYCLKNGVSYEKVAEESSYKDSDNISPWAVDYVAFATKFRLINGFEDGEFKPKAELLREQAAVVLYKLINNK